MPVSELIRKESTIEWVRADSMSESINLQDSPHAEKILASFDAEDGLLVVFYPDGTQATDIFIDGKFYVFSVLGASLLDADGDAVANNFPPDSRDPGGSF